MRESELIRLIRQHPDRGEVPVDCVKAVCFVESGFNEWAYRYESHYKWFMGSEETLTSTERTGQMISWGLMQVMGGVAREHGFTGDLPQLCDPSTGLKYGLLHLRKFYAKYGTWQEALASYNAGSPRKNAEGKFFNQNYIDKVLRYWAQFEKSIPIKESEV